MFPKTNSGTSDHNMELAESSRQRQKKESSGIPWTILVVPRQDINNKALFRKCCSKYARHHRREYFHKSLFSRMEAIQKTSNYETLKYRNRHCFNVSFDFSIFKICLRYYNIFIFTRYRVNPPTMEQIQLWNTDVCTLLKHMREKVAHVF